MFIPMGAREVVPFVWSLIEDADSDLPEALRPIFAEACREIREIEARVKQVERQLEATAEQIPAVEHLRTIPGIGLLIATALVAFIGDIRRFPSGRHLASYLGLTPREYSSGLKRNLGRISKRGDGYFAHPPHPRGALRAHPRAEAATGPTPRVGEQPRKDSRANLSPRSCKTQRA